MTNFYDKWLAESERVQEKFRRSPVIARDGEIEICCDGSGKE